MQNDRFTTDELPRRVGPAAKLRRLVGTVIESDFDVQDDLLRSANDDVFTRASFRPTRVQVHIDLDTAEYHVILSGPWYHNGGAKLPGNGRHVFTGKDFLDADEHRNSLVVDGVIECLRVHGKMA